MSILLETRSLTYLYRVRSGETARGLRSLNLNVKRGEVVGLLGSNGAGKSTAFELIAGERRPQQGDVYLEGIRCGSLPLWKRARLGLAYLSQKPSIFERMTVIDNIATALNEVKKIDPKRVQDIQQIVLDVGLEQRANQRAQALSGGERQRLAIARLMAMAPKVFLLDEPFTALDPCALDAMRTIIFMLKEKGVGILLTDHRAEYTFSLCDRVYLLSEGEILTSGSPDEVCKHPTVQATYLGSNHLSFFPSNLLNRS